MNLSIKDGKAYQELEMEVLLNEYEDLRISIEKKEKKCNEITKEERQAIVKLLKNFEVHITGTKSINEAINISSFPSGFYLLKVNNKIFKFRKL